MYGRLFDSMRLVPPWRDLYRKDSIAIALLRCMRLQGAQTRALRGYGRGTMRGGDGTQRSGTGSLRYQCETVRGVCAALRGHVPQWRWVRES